MRTTIELPDDLHTLARELAHQRGVSMSEVVADLMRRALAPPDSPTTARSKRGMPIVRLGGASVTNDEVRSLEDE